jgi:hypothetical protein
VPFDARSRKVTGAAKQVASGLPNTMIGPVDFAVSRTGTLVYTQEDFSPASTGCASPKNCLP